MHSRLTSTNLVFLMLGSSWLVFGDISHQILSSPPTQRSNFYFYSLEIAHKMPACMVTLVTPSALFVCAVSYFASVLFVNAPGWLL